MGAHLDGSNQSPTLHATGVTLLLPLLLCQLSDRVTCCTHDLDVTENPSICYLSQDTSDY